MVLFGMIFIKLYLNNFKIDFLINIKIYYINNMPAIIIPFITILTIGICASRPANRFYGSLIKKTKRGVSILSTKIQKMKFIKKIYKTDCKDNCIICFDDYSENKKCAELYCGHKFHKTCIIQWMDERKTCPLCNNGFLLKSGKFYDSN